MSDCWFKEEYWSDYNIINLLSTDKYDLSDKDYDAEQSINLCIHFMFNHLYMFVLVQLEIESDFENVYQDTEFLDYIF